MASVTIFDTDERIEVDLTEAPFQHQGLPGSILDVILHVDADIDHACQGRCSCTTCMVYVMRGAEHLVPIDAAEKERLGKCRDRRRNSRLACKAVITDNDADVLVRVAYFPY